MRFSFPYRFRRSCRWLSVLALLLARPVFAEDCSPSLLAPPENVMHTIPGNTQLIIQRGRRNVKKIDQAGTGNALALAQIGDDNVGRIKQQGDGNRVAIAQRGHCNQISVHQSGGGNSAVVRQHPAR